MSQQPAALPTIPRLLISGVYPDTTITCTGELEGRRRADRLRSVAVALIGAGMSRLSIDASSVTFMDCSGIGALVAVRAAAAAAGAELVLASPARPVVRLLRLAGLDGAFDIDAQPTGIAA